MEVVRRACAAIVVVGLALGAARGEPPFVRRPLALTPRHSPDPWNVRVPTSRALDVDRKRIANESQERAERAGRVEATYAKAWVAWERGELDDAIAWLRAAADLARDLDRTLYWIVLRDHAAAHAHAKKPPDANRAFAQADAGRIAPQLAAYADESVRLGKHEQAADAYWMAYEAAPDDADACRRVVDHLRARIQGGPIATVVDAVKRAQKTRCVDEIAPRLLELALIWHVERHGLSSPGVVAAVEIYEWIERTRQDDLALTARFLRSEIAWLRADAEHDAGRARDKWRDAARAATFSESQAARLDRALAAFASLDGDPADLVASRQAALAWKHALALEIDPTPTTSRMPDRLEMHADQAAAAHAFTAYARRLAKPRDPEALALQHLAGVLYWRSGHAREAADVLENVATHGRDLEFAEAAGVLLLDALERAGRKRALKKWRKALAR